jgi:hypothetical protein
MFTLYNFTPREWKLLSGELHSLKVSWRCRSLLWQNYLMSINRNIVGCDWIEALSQEGGSWRPVTSSNELKSKGNKHCSYSNWVNTRANGLYFNFRANDYTCTTAHAQSCSCYDFVLTFNLKSWREVKCWREFLWFC